MSNFLNPLDAIQLFGQGLSGGVQGFANSQNQLWQYAMQDEQARRQRLADAQAAEDRKRKLLGEKVDAGNKQIQTLRAGGLNDQAAQFFNTTQRGLMEQQNGFAPPELAGGRRNVTMGDLEGPTIPNFTLSADNRPQMPDWNDARTTGLLDAFSGYKAPVPKYEQEDPFKNTVRIDPKTGARTVVQPGKPRPQTGTTYGQPYVDPVTGKPMQTGSNGRVVPVGGQGGKSGGDWAADNQFWGQTIEQKYGIPSSGQRTPAEEKAAGGQSGIHLTPYARDFKVDPNSATGQRIVAELNAAGVYTYTKLHGTGPHIHAEFNRNPDGSAKTGRSGGSAAKGGMTWGEQYVDANGNTVQKSNTGAIKVLQRANAAKPKADPNIMTDRQIEADARAYASFEAGQYGDDTKRKALFEQKKAQLKQERDARVKQQRDAAKRSQPKTGPSKADLLLKRLEAL